MLSGRIFLGYGNIAPVTTGGRTFTVIYALFGIPLALVVYGKVGFWLDRSLARLLSRFTRHKHLSKREKIARSVVNLFGGTFLFMLVPPIGFMRRENWSYGEGLYYSFITLTTIGLGDFVAGSGVIITITKYSIIPFKTKLLRSCCRFRRDA